jgi:hypothetical protein
MKNKDEELIQQLIEHRLKSPEEIDLSADSQGDVDAYEILFRELSNETYVASDFTLADKVIRQIASKQHKAESVKYAAVILVVSTVFVMITSLAIMFVDPRSIAAFFGIVATHKAVFLFIVISITGIQVLDKVFVKKDAQSLPV